MSDQFDHTTEIFATSNRFLAKALAFAGCHFSAYREYDQQYLDAHKCKSIKEAERRRLPGRETWFFYRTEELTKAALAFDEENDAIDALVKADEPIPFCEDARVETKCREFVRAMRGSKEVDKTLFNTTPCIRVWEDGEVSRENTDQGTITTWPASKIMGLKANDEIRKHLKL